MNPRDIMNRLDPEKRKAIQRLYNVFHENGYEIYMVGGAVRDLLLGRPVKDIDFTTSARPETVQSLFRRTIPTGIKHGTISVLLDGMTFEVTTFRTESVYSDGRRPDQIQYANSLSEDLSRRDFTINALAFDIGRNIVIDEHNGMDDLNSGLIRTIGSPVERFYEDGLRPVRACRFSATLEFDIEEKTFEACQDRYVQSRTSNVAVERFTDELNKGFSAPAVSRMIHNLETSGLLFIFFPGKPEYSDQEKLAILDSLYPCPFEFRFVFWIFTVDRNLEVISSDARRLKLSKRSERLMRVSGEYLNLLQSASEKSSDSGVDRYRIKKFLSQSLLAVDCYSFLAEVHAAVKKIRKYFSNASDLFFDDVWLNWMREDPLLIRDLAVNGQDMQALGFQGLQIGSMLARLLDEVLQDSKRNQKETLLEIAKSHYKS